MKIAIISNSGSDNFGGSEIFAEKLSKCLKNHKIFFLRGFQKGIKSKIFRKIISDYYNPINYRMIISFIKENKPDLINLHNLYGLDAYSIKKINHKVPIIITAHDLFLALYSNKFPEYINNLHRKILISNLKDVLIISPSEFLYKKLKLVGYNKLKIIHNGGNIPSKTTNYKRDIVFVGRLSTEKGLQTIINTLNQVKDYQILVLGNGLLKKELEYKYKNINFLGFKNPFRYYKRASILAYPSICEENQPLSILEAMSYGLCVIASNIGGIPELVKHMETGLLFEPRNERDFKEKLDYLINNPEEIKRMGRNARKFVKKNFDWKRVVKQYEEVYKETIKKFKERNTPKNTAS